MGNSNETTKWIMKLILPPLLSTTHGVVHTGILSGEAVNLNQFLLEIAVCAYVIARARVCVCA